MKKKYIIICMVTFSLGMLLVSIHNDWIMFRFPSYVAEVENYINAIAVPKKEVQLWYWHNNQWHNEKTNLIWQPSKTHQIQYLINTWLTFLDEEHIMDKKVSLQTVLLASSDQEALLSFDRMPLDPQSSTFNKWMWVEGLLKTIRENKIPLQRIRLLVHHQPLNDDHLDFSNPWPLHGFVN